MFQLLDDPQFQAVDKIKTIGSTYMAAVGLMPHLLIEVSFTERRRRLNTHNSYHIVTVRC